MIYLSGNKGKNLMKVATCIIIPYLIIAIPIMWYNNARFNSVFDFGAQYQLTVVDVTNLSDRYKDIPTGLFDYLVRPLTLKKSFPFLQNNYDSSGHTENYFNGGIVSGALFQNLTLIIYLYGIVGLKKIKDKTLKCFLTLLFIIGIIMCIAIIVTGATLQRYMTDFFWMLSTGAMILWLVLYQNVDDNHKKIVFLIALIFIIYSIGVGILGTFFNSEYQYYEKLKK